MENVVIVDAVRTPMGRSKEVEPPDAEPWQPQASLAEALAAKSFTRRIQDFWRVTSYTGLQ
ncbi:hypothetical protein, partial [Serratia sp. ME43]|uniref:hypothetical protein n=1 Tax=Serratia sp. ME43 TaxID=2744256 RepID=UPI0015F61345